MAVIHVDTHSTAEAEEMLTAVWLALSELPDAATPRIGRRSGADGTLRLILRFRDAATARAVTKALRRRFRSRTMSFSPS